MLNQEYWQVIPTGTYFTSFEFNGTSIDSDSVIAYSLLSSLAGLMIAAALMFIAIVKAKPD